MRILILATQFPPGSGGIGTHAHELATWLSKWGWQVLVIAPQPYANESEIKHFNASQTFRIIAANGKVDFLRKPFYRWLLTSSHIRQFQPDLMLASGDRAVYLAAALAQRFKLPWVAVEHGRVPPLWERGIKRWAFQKASAVVCVSEYTKTALLHQGIAHPEMAVIPNGADDSRFRILPENEVKQFRMKKGLTDKRVILTVGKVSERKGQDIVIRAMTKIIQKIPNAHYFMAGVPARETAFRETARRCGVEDRVHFAGQVSEGDLIGYLNAAEVFVLTSRHTPVEFEGYGIAVVEAALCAKPAVVSSNSGLVEAVNPGQTGLVVSENDADETAEAILRLMENKELRGKMASAARARALEEQRWEMRAREYDSFLHQIAPAVVL